MREASISRKTKETNVEIKINLDKKEECIIETGIGFLNHMLELFAFHSGVTLVIKCDGDLFVDGHHSVEDIGIVLGKVIKEALGDKKV